MHNPSWVRLKPDAASRKAKLCPQGDLRKCTKAKRGSCASTPGGSDVFHTFRRLLRQARRIEVRDVAGLGVEEIDRVEAQLVLRAMLVADLGVAHPRTRPIARRCSRPADASRCSAGRPPPTISCSCRSRSRPRRWCPARRGCRAFRRVAGEARMVPRHARSTNMNGSGRERLLPRQLRWSAGRWASATPRPVRPRSRR